MLVDEIHKIQEDQIKKNRIDAEFNYQINKDKVIEYIKEYAKNNPTKEFMKIRRENRVLYLGYNTYDNALPIEELCGRIIEDNYNRLTRELQQEGIILEKIEVYELIITDKFLKTKPLEVKVDEYYKISWGK